MIIIMVILFVLCIQMASLATYFGLGQQKHRYERYTWSS